MGGVQLAVAREGVSWPMEVEQVAIFVSFIRLLRIYQRVVTYNQKCFLLVAEVKKLKSYL